MRHLPACPAALALGPILIALTGCATLETAADSTRDFARAHPVLTSVVAGVAVGSIAASAVHHSRHPQRPVRRPVEHLPADLDPRAFQSALDAP